MTQNNQSPSNIILFDGAIRPYLLPLSFTRPVGDFRFGILTMRQKWERVLSGTYSYLTEGYLRAKYPLVETSDNLFVAANVCPTLLLAAEIVNLTPGEALVKGDRVLAYRGDTATFTSGVYNRRMETESELLCFDRLYDLFLHNGQAIEEDFRLLTEGRMSQPISDSVRVIGTPYYPDGTPRIFLEEGAKAECVILNVTEGPIYIGRDAELQEGSVVRGPFAACEHSVVHINAKVYGATTLGPYCKVGGELNNALLFGYSNKAHEGYLGNAVVGEWCNLGAGTNASNLKNDYAEIKLWSYPDGRFLRTGLQFCGVIMGDHSKTGINSMLNTATVLGVGVNIHGSGFPRNFVPSFSDGGNTGFSDVNLHRFFDMASRMMARRGHSLTDAERAIFEHIYSQAENYK